MSSQNRFLGAYVTLGRVATCGKGGEAGESGLRAYAESIGQNPQNVSLYRQAAEVMGANRHVDITLLSKAKHLAAIHKLPREVWPQCVEFVASKRR